MTLDETAWVLYCETTAGDMHVADFWHELPVRVKEIFRDRVRAYEAIGQDTAVRESAETAQVRTSAKQTRRDAVKVAGEITRNRWDSGAY